MKKLTVMTSAGEETFLVERGARVFDVLQQNGFSPGPCGGKGSCGKCLVKCDVPFPMGESERQKLGHMEKQGYRLACYLYIEEDMCIKFLEQGGEAKINADVLSAIIETDHENGYGIAFDIGTTTIAGFLIDLKTATIVYQYSELNRQKAYGADVITRCQYVIENSTPILQTCILEQLNDMMKKMISNDENIIRVALAGNPAMLQICAGLPVDRLAVLPYEPAYHEGFTVTDFSFQAIPAGTPVLFMPLVAGYIGGDALAASSAVGQDKTKKISLMVDIGTNGEMILGNDEHMICCSAAAGPAFEGGKIRYGMGGVEGAIEKVIDHNGLRCTTIGNKPAEGICGSGLIDLIALLIKKGCIDESGRLSTEHSLDEFYTQRFDESGSFLVCSVSEGAIRNIYLTQQDIREIQLTKSAIAAGIAVLRLRAGIDWEEIDVVYLAGGFGNYIDHQYACFIGLIPWALRNKIKGVGNAAGLGVCRYVASKANRTYVAQLNQKMNAIELANAKEFNDLFMDNMLFEQAVDA